MGTFKDLEDSVRNTPLDMELPSFDFDLGPVSILVWKKFKFELEICKTEPYEFDGETPLIFVRIGWFELLFYSKLLYSFLYKRKYGFKPRGLE